MSDLFHYQLEALAPLVFRSGKPFGVNAGADGAAFPLPSSLAGLLRSLWAEQQGEAFSPELHQIAAYGPLLAWREPDNTLIPLAPAPADAQYVTVQPDKQNGQADGQQAPQPLLRRRSPQPLPDTIGCDLPAGLLPVWNAEDIAQNPGKPATGPQYWPLTELVRWSQGDDENITLDALNNSGLRALTDSVRTHVAITPESQAAADGQLFQTAGLDLAPQRQADGGWATRELVWLASSPKPLVSRLATFGGERRLSRLHPLDAHAAPAHWLRPCEDQIARMLKQGGLRLTLLTPALFAGGHLPGWLNTKTESGRLSGQPPGCPGLTLTLRAIAAHGWQPVSGWDLAKQQPRAARKALKAGAVLWFTLDHPAQLSAEALRPLWTQALSDDPQDQCDGFGLALPAAWTPPPA